MAAISSGRDNGSGSSAGLRRARPSDSVSVSAPVLTPQESDARERSLVAGTQTHHRGQEEAPSANQAVGSSNESAHRREGQRRRGDGRRRRPTQDRSSLAAPAHRPVAPPSQRHQQRQHSAAAPALQGSAHG